MQYSALQTRKLAGQNARQPHKADFDDLVRCNQSEDADHSLGRAQIGNSTEQAVQVEIPQPFIGYTEPLNSYSQNILPLLQRRSLPS